MESQSQNPEFRNNPETFTHVIGILTLSHHQSRLLPSALSSAHFLIAYIATYMDPDQTAPWKQSDQGS